MRVCFIGLYYINLLALPSSKKSSLSLINKNYKKTSEAKMSGSIFQHDQQWKEVKFDKRKPGGGVQGESKSQAVKKAIRQGTAVTESRQKVGANKSAAFVGAKNMRKLDENTTDTKHEKVSKSFSKALTQARLAKKMNQKQLAQAICEKPTVINEYESGKAIPNGAIINKLNRALGCQLPKAKGPAKKKT